MTHEEKNAVIQDHCCTIDCISGEECKIKSVCDRVHGEFRDNPRAIDEAYNILTASNSDVVNHPSHYCREDAMESIDEMVLIFGKEAVKNFCLCNVWKYRYRAADKNGEEDLKKSDWYIKKYQELCES